MKKVFPFVGCIALLWLPQFASTQNNTLGGKKKTGNSEYADFFFFNGSYNLVAFSMHPDDTCYEITMNGEDSAGYCFSITEQQFGQVMDFVAKMRTEIEKQTGPSVLCKYCQTMQLFWNDGEKNLSIIKRAYNIPPSFNALLDYCYSISDRKEICTFDKEIFKCFEGYEDYIVNPGNEK